MISPGLRRMFRPSKLRADKCRPSTTGKRRNGPAASEKPFWAEATLTPCLRWALLIPRSPARGAKTNFSPALKPRRPLPQARMAVISGSPVTFFGSPQKCFRNDPGLWCSAPSQSSCPPSCWLCLSTKRYSPAAGAHASISPIGRRRIPGNTSRLARRRFAHGRSQGPPGLYRTARSSLDAPPAPLARAAADTHSHADHEPPGQWLAVVFARHFHTRMRGTKPLPCFLCRRPVGSRSDSDLSAGQAAQPPKAAMRDRAALLGGHFTARPLFVSFWPCHDFVRDCGRRGHFLSSVPTLPAGSGGIDCRFSHYRWHAFPYRYCRRCLDGLPHWLSLSLAFPLVLLR